MDDKTWTTGHSAAFATALVALVVFAGITLWLVISTLVSAPSTPTVAASRSHTTASAAPAKASQPAARTPPPVAKSPSLAAKPSAAPKHRATPPDDAVKIHTSHAGVNYVSGGVGVAETVYLRHNFPDYSLQMVNYRKQGKRAYVYGVQVKISDSSGNTVLQTMTNGPYLFADLPAGTYKLAASLNNASQGKALTIQAGQGQQTIKLFWTTADGQ